MLPVGNDGRALAFAETWGSISGDEDGEMSLHWLWSHAENMRILTAPADGLEHGYAEDVLELRLREVAVPNGVNLIKLTRGSSSQLKQAEIVQQIMSLNLREASVKYDSAEGLTLVLTPIVAIYYMLAQAIHQDRIRHCDECGAAYIAADNRQRFCPPAPSWAKRGKASACGARARKQRGRRAAK